MSALARVAPGAAPVRWEVRVPGSKSLTNRALLLAGVAAGESSLARPLRSDDTEVMARALRELGARVEADADELWRVDGLSGAPHRDAALHCGMAGTVGRFLLPVLAAGHGRFTVDAHPQLRRRPLGPVLDALRAQGAAIDGDAFPLTLDAGGLAGGEVAVDASISSQFLSGLLMAAPLAARTTTLRFGPLVSAAYLRLTIDVMRAFGAEVAAGAHHITVAPQPYVGARYEVEPDASSASYFLAAAAVTGTTVRLRGLDRRATAQGDIALVDILERMGCTVRDGADLELTGPDRLRGVTADMDSSSDVFMTLACAAVFADGATTIEGIGHARVKESDRIAACAENLRRLGVAVDEGPDFLRVHPGRPRAEVRLPTYEDHRIAMAFSVIGTRVPVRLEDPPVVAKTFPGFFELWPATGARVELIEAGG
ncbi:MAG TPA: 3-phosphoshikimate 1-carboxyvinyltransferase [Solirubrobacteraceae bacterium]|nr:3-phosphoshikimate 1-carboxyvinyltransferase [Solirubrobacteraceae bacterium]